MQATKDPIELKRRCNELMDSIKPQQEPMTVEEYNNRWSPPKVDRSDEGVKWQTHDTTRDEELNFKLTN